LVVGSSPTWGTTFSPSDFLRFAGLSGWALLVSGWFWLVSRRFWFVAIDFGVAFVRL
jgi:hypothetical protein